MKTIRIILTLTLFIGFSSFQQGESNLKLKNSLLWKIEGKGAKTSYLFGTIHLISSDKFFMPKKAEKAFEDCEVLMMELDVTDKSIVNEMMQYASLPDGQTLDKLMSKEQYALLDSAILAAAGIGLEALKHYKPLVIESFLIKGMIEGELESFELAFAEMAKQNTVPIRSLETIQEQMTIFDEVPFETQIEDLMNYAKGDEDLKELFKELVDLYLKEDLNAMNDYMEGYFPDEEMLKKLLDERNVSWVPRIERSIKEEPMFIAVGAGHLGGEEGVINLLRERGYKVSPVF